MILIGSRNKSESQLAAVLHLHEFNVDRKKLEELMHLRDMIMKANHDIILTSTHLYVHKSIALKEEYKQILRQCFQIKPKSIDFSQVEETVRIMNKDAMDSTDDVIDEVIHEKDITENKNVKLIMTKALFIRGFWATSFDEVIKEDFHFAKREQKANIQMMRQLGRHRYLHSKQLKAQIVSLEYVTSDLQMVLFLPDDESSDAFYLINELNHEKWVSIMTSMRAKKKVIVELTIPRFALDAQKVSLQRTLIKMGAIDIFDESLAHLSAMCDQKIHLTKLVHKAFILVDERGSSIERVAVERNKNQLNGKAANTKPIKVKANHPFVFIIMDKVSIVALFMGLFADPREMLEVVRESDLSAQQISELLSNSDAKHN
jgi:serpin B